MKLRKILILPVVLIAIAAALPLLWQTRIDALGGKLADSLKQYGFTNPQTEKPQTGKGRIAWTDIKLDEDGFSAIRAIQIKTGLMDTLLSRPPQTLTIDGIRLTGAWTDRQGLTVIGWKQPRALPPPSWQDILLTGGQIDLDTPAGALRLEAKGRGARQQNGDMKLEGLLWGVQNQLKFSASLEGTVTANGGWLYDIQLLDGNLNFDRIQASRASGWLTLENTEAQAPEISAQIDAGKLTLGDLSFSNVGLTLQGPWNDYSIVAKADIYGYENMQAVLDIKGFPNSPQIQASLETASLDDLIDVLGKLKSTHTATGTLTTLLLTEGNLKRLRKEIAPLNFDRLELQIYGPLYDLAGKVIAKTISAGTEQRHVISLDPGNG